MRVPLSSNGIQRTFILETALSGMVSANLGPWSWLQPAKWLFTLPIPGSHVFPKWTIPWARLPLKPWKRLPKGYSWVEGKHSEIVNDALGMKPQIKHHTFCLQPEYYISFCSKKTSQTHPSYVSHRNPAGFPVLTPSARGSSILLGNCLAVLSPV